MVSKLERTNHAVKKYSWFTLVELVVVITIISVLATIGFLQLQGYSGSAKDSAVRANVRSVFAAISSESAITNNSPRYYVVHDPSAALTGAAVAYVEGNPTVLTGGDWNQADTNYSAGNPDWAKLKINPDRFRITELPWAIRSVFAAYDPKQVSVGAADVPLAPTASGRKRSSAYFQAAGTTPTGVAAVVGNFPAPTAAQLSAWAVAGLVKGPVSALVDGAVPTNASQYPGCDTPDITLPNGQVWAACNAGATTAYAGQAYPSWTAPTAGQKAYLGAYFQWGRNDDVTAQGSPTSVQAAAWTSAAGVGHSEFITNTGSYPYDWIAAQNGNLWGGSSTSLGSGTFTGQTAINQALMRGPCASGYHVPTQAEWYSAAKSISPGLANGASLQNDTAVASQLKLPLVGQRAYADGGYVWQWTYGYYWSSSPSSTLGNGAMISSTQFSPALNTAARGLGFSVRCLKN